MKSSWKTAGVTVLPALVFAPPAMAADGRLPGDTMSFWWTLPFAGLVLSIATGPLIFPDFWQRHHGKITAIWAALSVLPMVIFFGVEIAAEAVLHTLLLEYMSFIVLLFALFTIAGGILVTGNIRGSPLVNAGLLVLGAALASVIGTTGASMIMIRPIIRANDNRPFNAHVIIFFIFLVSNIGGSLTPLGDPPLFIGFLRGVDFFWTTANLYGITLFVGGAVLLVFFVLDLLLYRREKTLPPIKDPTPVSKVRVRGLANFVLLAGVVAAILLSAKWQSHVALEIGDIEFKLQNILRDAVILLLSLLSLAVTKSEYRAANQFAWGPICEVAKLFAGIFVCIVPVVAILRAGSEGALGPLVAMVTATSGEPSNIAYFWVTGALSSFLDNAPTYLVFFELASGDAKSMMTTLSSTLVAISAGAVFMGANTYIGNAPNFMVYAIARQRGVRMPGFFGYMLWSGAILIPIFLLAGWLFFL